MFLWQVSNRLVLDHLVLTLWQRACELGITEDTDSCMKLVEEQMFIFSEKAMQGNNKENQINW